MEDKFRLDSESLAKCKDFQERDNLNTQQEQLNH